MVSNAVDRPFQYLVPPHLRSAVRVGSRVRAPFRSRQMAAYVVALEKEPAVAQPREILEAPDADPVLLPEFVALSAWLSQEYFSRRIEAIRLCLPPGKEKAKNKLVEYVLPLVSPDELLAESARLKARAFRQALLLEHLAAAPGGLPWKALRKKTGAGRQSLVSLLNKEFLKIEALPGARRPWEAAPVPAPARPPAKLQLTDEQAAAWVEIKKGLDGAQKQFLIYGVTGSGKTELYLRAAEAVIEKGRTVLFLVPEIALTTQIIAALKMRFPGKLALLHSSLTPGERYEQWLRVSRGETPVVLGARSAVFAPLDNIGLIVMDEEHENTYKQSESPRYHTRNVAKWRAAYHNAVLLLGSATPSLETFQETEGEKVKLLRLTRRVAGHLLPAVQIVDMREEFKVKNRGIFSRSLRKAMEETLSRGEQIMLFLNRRGYAGFMLCRQCGLVLQCPSCDVSLTYHFQPEHLECHYCGFRSAPPAVCPRCKSRYLQSFGLGTQKVEKEVKSIFPAADVIRMDSDTTMDRGSYARIWNTFKDKKASILIGTQMIAKGFDFPGVTLVGIVAADITLHLPDFRAGERTFQLLSQAAGRAGRGKLGGRVIIQTFTPWHYSIRAAAAHNYLAFLGEEFKRRKMLLYPPFSDIILINCSSPLDVAARNAAEGLRKELAEKLAGGLAGKAVDGLAGNAADGLTGKAGSLAGPESPAVELLGPVPAPLFRTKDRFRYHLIFKGTDLQRYTAMIRETVWSFSPETKEDVRITVDFNPLMML